MIYTQYGSPDVLRLEDIQKPVPKDGEVLVKVHAASANASDWYRLGGKPFLVRLFSGGLLKPKNTILGADVAGRVESLGRGVKQFRPGDEVYGSLSQCGLGGFSEYVCAPENALAPKPASMTFEEAAAVPLAALTALQSLRDVGHIKPGQKVLINGASGGVGTFAVQLAKYFGAEVTAVCSKGKLDMVRSLGADYVIDYTQEDFTKNGKRYDLILSANGYHPIMSYRRVLSPGGTYVNSGGTLAQMFEAMLLGPLISMIGGKKLKGASYRTSQEDMVFMKKLLEEGKVKPVIDRRYPLSQAAEALRYLKEGHARGKVVINIGGN